MEGNQAAMAENGVNNQGLNDDSVLANLMQDGGANQQSAAAAHDVEMNDEEAEKENQASNVNANAMINHNLNLDS